MKRDSQATVIELPRLDPGRPRRVRGIDPPGSVLAAYRHLAGRGELDSAQLAAGLELTREQAQAIVADLLSLRLVQATDTGRLLAIPHGQAIDELLAEQALTLTEALQRVTEGQRRLRTLVENRSLLDPAEASRVTTTALGDGAARGMFELPREAKETVSAIHPGGAFDDDLLSRSLARAQESLDRGLRLRVVHQTSALSHPSTVSYLMDLAALGGRIRLRDNLPFRMVLIDDATAVCTVPASGSYLLTGERVTVLLNRIFETTWVDAVPLERAMSREPRPLPATGGAAARRPAELTPLHEGILRLLAEGQTDRSIARVVGITTRTVTRRISEIYELLGVESRFQAGIAAKELGVV